MIAVETNILVYAYRTDSPHHAKASQRLTDLVESGSDWAIPWPCLHEFIGVVTHARIYNPPASTDEALDQVEAWFQSPTLVLLSEAEGYWSDLRATILSGRVSGPRIHDARIAALCQHHRVRELWTADRDFSRFPSLRTINPLI